jgi:hypothetical protein
MGTICAESNTQAITSFHYFAPGMSQSFVADTDILARLSGLLRLQASLRRDDPPTLLATSSQRCEASYMGACANRRPNQSQSLCASRRHQCRQARLSCRSVTSYRLYVSGRLARRTEHVDGRVEA